MKYTLVRDIDGTARYFAGALSTSWHASPLQAITANLTKDRKSDSLLRTLECFTSVTVVYESDSPITVKTNPELLV